MIAKEIGAYLLLPRLSYDAYSVANGISLYIEPKIGVNWGDSHDENSTRAFTYNWSFICYVANDSICRTYGSKYFSSWRYT
jgi:hypothetical protein